MLLIRPRRPFFVMKLICFLLPFLLSSVVRADLPEPAKCVDPMIGTDQDGHVFPGATAPFGMVQLSPDTGVSGWGRCSGYNYADHTLLGFSHTHLSGTGCGDLGNILFLPVVGQVPWEPTPSSAPGTQSLPTDRYRVHFDHADEHAEAGYYRVKIQDSSVVVELTATAHAAVHRYTFPQDGDAAVLIDLNHKVSSTPTDRFQGELQNEGDHAVSGWQHSNGWASDKTFYFYAEFSQPVQSTEFQADNHAAEGRSVEGLKILGALHFHVQPDQPLIVKVGISPTSVKEARSNMKSEIGDKSFDDVRAETLGLWNAALSRIAVDSSSGPDKRTFYTALYHTMVTPNLYNNVDGSYMGHDHQVHENPRFSYYSTFSLWDTFRAAHPLYTLIAPELDASFVQSIIQFAQDNQSGELPVWPLCSNETGCMIGYHSVPVIADAYFKGLGLGSFDPHMVLEKMKISANSRDGHEQYVKDGFAPSGFRDAQGVSRTLEYAYDDWCISQFAAAIGSKDDAGVYAKRSQNFRNCYDATVGFMRGRSKDGAWIENFNPEAIDFNCYTEANAWQYNWAVPQDVPALIELNGGPKAFTDKLDRMWATRDAAGGLQDVTGSIGQYAQGNEPSHHIAFLYDYAGEPWKTQEWVRKVMTVMYTDKADGICGNDDCGQMSAWFVFSALGLYPVNPASGVYMISSPLFPKASLTVGKKDEEKTFTIETENGSPTNVYIQSATLNGKSFDRAWITHKELEAGGVLHFVMSDQPNKAWGATSLPPATGYDSSSTGL